MKKKWPEIVLSSGDNRISQAIRRAVKSHELRKIAPKIYTSNFIDSPEQVLKKNRYQLLGLLFPNAVISHRSALEGGFSDGNIVLNYKYSKVIQFPGLTIRLVQGHGPDEEDSPFLENLYIASRGRAFLENLTRSRARRGYSKNVSQYDLEERLDRMIRVYGIEELNLLRDQARRVSLRLKMKEAFYRLDRMIGALLGTREAGSLTSARALSRAKGEPYDPNRIELFATLAAYLQQQELSQIPSTVQTKSSLIHQAFFESYFSNYIEGTEFAIEEAEKIIFENKIFPNRKEDSHDILSTFEMVSDRHLMQTVPKNESELIVLLQQRHARLMDGREETLPGRFKDKMNRAGNTVFVKPDEVKGTLSKGFSIYKQLKPGVSRALFMMFLVSEIHPFVDGNGRIARIMMNAEFDIANECRIIIPTVYREDYLLALRRLSRQQDPSPYVRMMLKAQAFTHSIPFEDYNQALIRLRAANAFMEPNEAKLIFHSNQA